MRILSLVIMACLLCDVAAATEITITPAACDQLVNYIEPPGVEYQPGVDANGDAVVPADLGNRQPVKPPRQIVVPITDYLASRLNASQTNGGVIQPQALLGTVALTDGILTFNGQPLGSDVDGDLGALCRKMRQAR